MQTTEWQPINNELLEKKQSKIMSILERAKNDKLFVTESLTNMLPHERTLKSFSTSTIHESFYNEEMIDRLISRDEKKESRGYKTDREEKLALEGKVEILKELFQTFQERADNREKILKKKLDGTINEKKKEKLKYDMNILLLHKELNKLNKINEKKKSEKDTMKRIKEENQYLNEQNETLIKAIAESEEELKNMKKNITELKQYMKLENKHKDETLSLLEEEFHKERQNKTCMHHEIADLEYVTTLIKNEDIIVPSRPDCNLNNTIDSIERSQSRNNTTDAVECIQSSNDLHNTKLPHWKSFESTGIKACTEFNFADGFISVKNADR